MSITNRHSVSPFVAGVSKALADQRLAKVGYKATKANPNPLKSICVSVPVISTPFTNEEIDRLTPHIVAMLENAQDGIIRGIYEKNNDVASIGDDEISVDACIEYLETVETGGRLTIEVLGKWFADNLADKLMEFLALQGAKKLSGEQLDNAVRASMNAYKAMITAMAGGKTHYDSVQRTKLETILAMTEEGDEVAEKLMKRLVAMEKKDQKIAGELGLIDFS